MNFSVSHEFNRSNLSQARTVNIDRY